MAKKLKELMQEDVTKAKEMSKEGQARLLAAIDWAEMFSWWSSRITGKLKAGGVSLSGLSIQPSKNGDGFCLTVRGKHERTDVVGFHFCGEVTTGLANARKRIEEGNFGWKADSPLVNVQTADKDPEEAKTFAPDRLSFG